ncbi:MAG: Gfo/Idh/MocA family oxidoreductase [candidate division Zixibacteria bacterium]|nr:Gfo/Idh/MocA family oxidoreductase [candidate division Zixibacteria bacterium]
MSHVHIGFIGAGALASAMHYPSVVALEDATIAAICDLNTERLNQTADRYGVTRRYTDYRRMLDEVALDAVYVIMPPVFLKPIVLDCFAAGKHVFMEKPPGVSVAEAQEMADTARAAGRLSMVAFNRRFSRVVVEAKKCIDERGPITQCMVEFHKYHLGTAKWDYYGVGMFETDVIHVVDLLRHFGGEVVAVDACVQTWHSDQENVFNAFVRFESGATGFLTANRASGVRYERFEIHGHGIAAYIRAPETAEVFTDNRTEPVAVFRGAELAGSDKPYRTYGFADESRHFIDCIKTGAQPLTCLDDAIKSRRLVDRILEAGRR